MDYAALARKVAKTIAFVIAVLGPAMSAYHSSQGDGEARAQAAKNKAEAGYQVTRQAMQALEDRVLALEQVARHQQDLSIAPKRGKAPRRLPAPPGPIIPVTVNARPKALPADLDKAERQVYRQAPAPPPRSSDASPP